ncbi:MAG: ribonucleoside-diphosphate reductase, adenosylcobalamin-dependent [Rhodobacteraceae bacterium]|nr:ribonucleoside-diphosphate reductase, adenosylcobalamin-dependent [Paracoccaceae bacterium]
MSDFVTPFSEQIWDMKYRYKDAGQIPLDKTVTDSWSRVAKSLASVEKSPERWEKIFYSTLEDFKFLPAGRILAGAGTGRSVTLFNCFVMGTVPDSIPGIFDMLKEAAITMQQGGGIGYDFSTIRPSGSDVKGVAADASGPLSFMNVWDSMCQTIMSAGSRRGAMMATMRCDHPDILSFVDAKSDSQKLRMFNLSVLVTDKFMDAVKNKKDWSLIFDKKIYKTVSAKYLWDKIMQSTYDFAEPGVIFIDRINAMNNLNYCETISATNPCGEQPLPPYGACLLGSINLSKMIDAPFSENSKLDATLLKETVSVAVRMMDNVIDVSKFPLASQEKEAHAKRRIGLGVTGLADALLMTGVRYGSDEAVAKTDEWLHLISREAYLASTELAQEKGSFPLLDVNQFLQSGNMVQMDDDVKEVIRSRGIRNALLTSIAPTGTISLYAGNVSSGIEPVFAYSYHRKVLQKDGTKREEEVIDYAVNLWKEKFGNKEFPDYFVNAQTLSPTDHVKMQAAAQKWIDSSISKTINCPEDISFEEFKEVYMAAWDQGCKGCTTYRPNAVTGSVLSVDTSEKKDIETSKMTGISGEVVYMSEPLARPKDLEGRTYKVKWPDSEHALYITINDILLHDQRRPFEIFVNSKNMEHFAWTVGLTRMISAVFRRGGDVSFVVDELKAVFDPRGGAWMGGKYIPSILAAIGNTIETHMIEIGFLSRAVLGPQSPEIKKPALTQQSSPTSLRLTTFCPSCGENDLHMIEGCMTCSSCGHSKCA